MLEKQHFIDQYWQKKPLVIKNAFTEFADPLDQDELAGLAMEAEIDARIVAQDKQKWSVSHGPFDDFASHCVGEWTLLVQSVDKYSDAANTLLRAFDFIPTWRIDDLMVSFSNCGGGVGPHLDQYDVFIVQGQGTRRWQVGAKKAYQSLSPTKDLQQIDGFDPIIDEVLHPGDLIYIPPGFPHNGVALENCMNYSIGFRAPTQNELLNALADYAGEKKLFKTRYTDPNIPLRQNPFELQQSEKDKFRQMFTDMIDSTHFDDFLGHFFSENPSIEDEDELDQMEDFSRTDIAEMLATGVQFHPDLNAKIVQQEIIVNDKNQHITWVNQHKIITDPIHFDAFQQMLNAPCIDNSMKLAKLDKPYFLQTLSTLVNSGAWYA